MDKLPKKSFFLTTYLRDHWKTLAIWLALFGFFYGIGYFVPVGYDWNEFSQGIFPDFWTPWTPIIIKLFNLPLLFAVTLFAVTFRSFRNSHSILPVVLAILSLPTLWVLFLGNLDGIVLAGLLLLPWGAPLALMKPQLAAFALLAKKKFLLAGVAWGAITLIIWGFWPGNFKLIMNSGWQASWPSDITLFPWGMVLGLPLLWFSRKDEDLLMAAGSFITPHLFPYHYILLMPSLSRMRPGWMVATWLVSWLPLSSNWIGPLGWHFGNLLGAMFWMGIYFKKNNVYFQNIFHLPKKQLPSQEITDLYTG